MNERTSFYRKVGYGLVIAVLLAPIFHLGAPSTVDSRGGTLAQLREDNDLGQSNLGEIDPASETIRLATLGLRGIAVSMLWSKAKDYKMKEDWTNFRATLEQLARLQPYFIAFWRYQAWNLSYNVSVELDDVRDRYYYVRRGIEFLKQGTTYNRDNPSLLSELGWFIGNKIGRADEREIYRRLFKADDDFHKNFNEEDLPPDQRDNWLVARGMYEDAVSAVDDKKKSLGQKNPTTFYAAPGMAQINYADAIETEGTFGNWAKREWSKAAKLWQDYGNRELRSSKGLMIRLNDLERWEEEQERLATELKELGAGVEAEIVEERRAQLTPEQQEALDTPAEDRTDEQFGLVATAERLLEVTPQDIADAIAQQYPDKMVEARKLALRIAENHDRVFLTRNNREVVNYAYWAARCDFEQSAEALKAHQLAYDAGLAFEESDLAEARRLYEESFDLWAKALEANPALEVDSPTGSDLMEFVEKYGEVLTQLELSLADPEVADRFALWEVVEANDQERKFAAALEARRNRQQGQPESSDAESQE